MCEVEVFDAKVLYRDKENIKIVCISLPLFVQQVLETITHPYSPEFVQLFLPMVENEEITGSMRGEGQEGDPVSEFIGNRSFTGILIHSFFTWKN